MSGFKSIESPCKFKSFVLMRKVEITSDRLGYRMKLIDVWIETFLMTLMWAQHSAEPTQHEFTS